MYCRRLVQRFLIQGLGLALCSGAWVGAHAGRQAAVASNVSVPAVSAADAQRWLTRIQQAPAQSSFQGTFIVAADMYQAKKAETKTQNSRTTWGMRQAFALKKVNKKDSMNATATPIVIPVFMSILLA